MRQDIVSIKRFYQTPLGWAVAHRVGVKLSDLWGADIKGQSVLGLGYASPVLEAMGDTPRRRISAIPQDCGTDHWKPSVRGNANVVVDELRLPFADGQFERTVVMHGLEECQDPRAYLREIWRVTAPEGRIVLIAPNRTGLWSRATRTPFGHGRPWSRPQLINLLSNGMFQVTASSHILYMPPINSRLFTSAVDAWDTVGRWALPGLGGVVMVEAVKRLFASPRDGVKSPALKLVKPARTVRPASRNHVREDGSNH